MDTEQTATAYAARAFGKAGGGPELYKSSSGHYKNDAVHNRQLFTAAALGINQLPSSTFLIPIATSGSIASDSLTVTPINEPYNVPLYEQRSMSAPGSISRFSFDSVISQQAQQQPSILLNHLSQTTTVTSNKEPRLLRQSQETISNGQSLLIIEKNPRNFFQKRRWSADRLSSNSKQTVSVLDYQWPNGKFIGVESQKSRLPVPKSSNYVTVEVVCRDDDKIESASEISGDFPNESENPKIPDVVIVESPSTDESKHQEPEVHNISSGSSEIQLLDSPPPETKAVSPEHFKTDRESNGSTAFNFSFNRDRDAGINDIDSVNSHKDDDDFLKSVFPGKYGFKIEIVEVEGSSSNSCEQPSDPDEQSEDRLEHVQVEEAHIPTPLGNELENVEKMKEGGEYDRSLEESSSEKLPTVPDNKPVDIVELDEEDDLDTASQPSSSDDKASSLSQPTECISLQEIQNNHID